MKKFAFTWGELLVVLCIIGMLAVLFQASERGSRVTGRRTVCLVNLSQIGLALLHYHERYDVFPPAYVANADGEPLYSWRVLILPFLEQQELYEQFNLDEPWNSEANRNLLGARPAIYRCPSMLSGLGEASYVMIVGPGTISDGPHSVSLKEITDKHAGTILLAETLKPIPWTAPIDVPLEKGIDRLDNGLGSNHLGVVNAVFVDRSVRALNERLQLATLRALATIAGGETVAPSELH